MSLIKCSECGKDYSDKATNCPNCGSSATTSLNKEDKQKEGTIMFSQKKLLVISCVLFAIAILGLIYGITRFKNMGANIDAYEIWKSEEKTAFTTSMAKESKEKIIQLTITGFTSCICSGILVYIGVSLQRERMSKAVEF